MPDKPRYLSVYHYSWIQCLTNKVLTGLSTAPPGTPLVSEYVLRTFFYMCHLITQLYNILIFIIFHFGTCTWQPFCGRRVRSPEPSCPLPGCEWHVLLLPGVHPRVRSSHSTRGWVGGGPTHQGPGATPRYGVHQHGNTRHMTAAVYLENRANNAPIIER